MTKPLTLAAKVLAVSRSIGAVEKNGLNQHFKFKFQAWDDVLPAVRNACVEHGVQITPTVKSVTHDGQHVLVEMAFTVRDTESDQRDEFVWFGESKGNDDKGIQKAITSCTKYALLKYLMIPIVDDTDTDADGPAKPAAKPAPAPAPTKVTVEDARTVMRNSVKTRWQEMGGTNNQFTQLRELAVAKGQDVFELVHAALADGCPGIEDIEAFVHEVLAKK
jgi:hypothetical protein